MALLFLAVLGGVFVLGGAVEVAVAAAAGPLFFCAALGLGFGSGRLLLRRVPVRPVRRSRVYRQPDAAAVVLVMTVSSAMGSDSFGFVLAVVVLAGAAGFLGLVGGCELAVVAWSRGVGFWRAAKEVWLLHRQVRETEWNAAVGVCHGGALQR